MRRLLGGIGLVAATLLAAPLEARGEESDEVRALLESFDAAWAAGDLDALMEPISPSFGCELYGDVNRAQLRETFGLLLQELGDTRSTTHVLDVTAHGAVFQAYTCRRFAPPQRPDETLEELCHVFYLEEEEGEPRIIGLEEYDHDGLACLADGRFEPHRFAFSVDVPDDHFIVPVPESGSALEEVVLRGATLDSELRILLLQSGRAIDLEDAFDADLRDWTRENRPAKVESRRRVEVAGRPAWQATSRYSGPSCRLSANERDVEPRRSRRIYVGLDDRHLLTLTLQAPRAVFAAADAALDEIVASLEFDLDEDATYSETIARRNGWGLLEDGTFACPDSGLVVRAPDGFALELTRTGALLSLRATTAAGAPAFQIDCIPLLDPDVSLEDLIDLDDVTRSSARRGRRSMKVGEHRAVQVDRELSPEPSRARMEKVVYVRGGQHVVTVRIRGTPAEVAAAQPALDELLAGISLRR